jgi:hypothetical protein
MSSPGAVPITRASSNAIPDQYIVSFVLPSSTRAKRQDPWQVRLNDKGDLARHLGWLRERIHDSDADSAHNKIIHELECKHSLKDQALHELTCQRLTGSDQGIYSKTRRTCSGRRNEAP